MVTVPGRVGHSVQLAADPVDTHHRAIKDAQAVPVAAQPPQSGGQGWCLGGEQVDRFRTYRQAVMAPTSNQVASQTNVPPVRRWTGASRAD